MGNLVEKLSACLDERNEGAVCKFNGYVEDYLNYIEDNENKDDLKAILKQFYSMDEGCRIITQLAINSNQDAIANQIIRYKDVSKLPLNFFKVPYLIYLKHDEIELGVIFNLGNCEEAMYVKGSYFVLSEPGNQYEDLRNDLVSIVFNKDLLEKQFQILTTYFEGKAKAGHVQRLIDQCMFKSLDDMVEKAKVAGNRLCVEEIEKLKEIADPRDTIYECIKKWYYLKKFVYVQTMMDKNRLNTVYEGNSKRQRAEAKSNADAINYISFSECWKRSK